MLRNEFGRLEVTAAIAGIRRGEKAQELLERALGKALLNKMMGGETDLTVIYKNLGGSDPGILAMLSGPANDRFQELKIDAGLAALRTSAIDEKTLGATAKKSEKLALGDNPLLGVEGQALHTLATLGGTPFADKISGF
jgi:hypothetical protein